MIFRLVVGFILGITAVVLISTSFSLPEKENHNRDIRAEKVPDLPTTQVQPEQVEDKLLSLNNHTKEETTQTREANNERITDIGESTSMKPKVTIPEPNITVPSIEASVLLKGNDRQLTFPEDIPNDDTMADSEHKSFFWKPFSLKSRAEKFAKHITSTSGIDCLAEKIGTGNYWVYFSYLNEKDKLAKTAHLRNRGIVIQP